MFYKSSLDFTSNIYNGKISLEKAKISQYRMFQLLNDLKDESNKIRQNKI